MCQQTSGRSYHHVGTGLERLALLVVGHSVGSSVYGNAADRHEVCEALQLTVNLLRQLARRGHHNAVHGIFGETDFSQFVDYRKQIGGRLARACLGAGQYVATLQHGGYGMFLNRRTFVEMHVPQTVKYGIVCQ